MIISLDCASVDNHIPWDDIFDYHPLRECNIYTILLSKKEEGSNFDKKLFLSEKPILLTNCLCVFSEVVKWLLKERAHSSCQYLHLWSKEVILS